MKSKPTHLLDIPFHVIKSISKHLSNIISFIYNLCIEQGKYPDLLKHARVTPIHKSGDKLEVCNYRPISTLLSVNKIFEKLTYERMLSFIDSCGLITEYQFGFRKKRSTTDAIFEVIQFASSGLNKKEHVIYLFLDLKKAFDSVSHKILMSKLHKLGFRGNVHSFLKSYLSNRYQYVHINNYNSTLKNIKLCVP